MALGLVCGGIVEHEQRLEALDTRLCGISLHLLWLIHDDDRSVSGDHVNGTAAAKLIPFGIDDAALLAPSVWYCWILNLNFISVYFT